MNIYDRIGEALALYYSYRNEHAGAVYLGREELDALKCFARDNAVVYKDASANPIRASVNGIPVYMVDADSHLNVGPAGLTRWLP